MWWALALVSCCAPVLAFSAPTISVSDIEDGFKEGPHCATLEELLAGWDQIEGSSGVSHPFDWRNDQETGQESAFIFTLEEYSEQAGRDDILRQSKEDRVTVKDQTEGLYFPGAFHHEFPALASDAYNIEHETNEALHDTGPERLLFEWGWIEESSQPSPSKEGPGKGGRGRETVVASVPEQRSESAGKNSSVAQFKRFKTPKDFVEHWPEHKRLIESLAHSQIPEQQRAPTKAHRQFVAAGKLLEELGEKEFLQRFGEGTVKLMREAAAAEMRRQRRAAGNANGAAGNGSEIVKFRMPETPRDFVEHWEEQKRLFKNLPHPRTLEQERALKGVYYKFTAAGRLLEELEEDAFLHRFEGVSVEQMRKTAVAEIMQRKAVERNQKKLENARRTAGEGAGIVKFRKPRTPQDFVRHWEGQKRLFKSLPPRRTPEQLRELKRAYYSFTAAGQLLDELGREAFLQRFGEGAVDRMRLATVAEVQSRKTAIAKAK